MRLCPSPFMKKRKPQPSPVEVLFRRSHEWAGWLWADAMRATERTRAEKRALKTKLPFTKKTTDLLSSETSKLTSDRREQINQPSDPARSDSRRSGGVGVRDACKLARQLPCDGKEQPSGGEGSSCRDDSAAAGLHTTPFCGTIIPGKGLGVP